MMGSLVFGTSFAVPALGHLAGADKANPGDSALVSAAWADDVDVNEETEGDGADDGAGSDEGADEGAGDEDAGDAGSSEETDPADPSGGSDGGEADAGDAGAGDDAGGDDASADEGASETPEDTGGSTDAGESTDAGAEGDGAEADSSAESDTGINTNSGTSGSGTTSYAAANVTGTTKIVNKTTAESAIAEASSTSVNAAGDEVAATPNEEFGEPTTSVVIEGSVNGEIMAEVALAEPDGVPEGGDYNKYNYGSGEPWCAYFVMYCARAAKLDTTVIPNYASCPMMKSYYQSIDRWQDFTPDYRPHVGDLILFSESKGGIASHIGIVTASTDTTVTTREGNSGSYDVGQVLTHIYNTTDPDGAISGDYYILGYAAPDYPEQVTHEHTNVLKSITNVSETSHLVSYERCECGYEKPDELIAHNYESANAALRLTESDEWVCADCGAKRMNYTKGIRSSATAVGLYDIATGAFVKELPAGSSFAVTDVYVGDDGNYWGTTADGYKVLMSQAGVRQTKKFAEIDVAGLSEGAAQTFTQSAVAQTRTLVGSIDSLSLGNSETTARKSADSDTVDATCLKLADLKKDCLYVVTVDQVVSDCKLEAKPAQLGAPMLKLMSVAEDGSYDVNDLKVYGTSGYKLDYSTISQGVVISPKEDTSLVVACQGGKLKGSNDVTFGSIKIYQVK